MKERKERVRNEKGMEEKEGWERANPIKINPGCAPLTMLCFTVRVVQRTPHIFTNFSLREDLMCNKTVYISACCH